MDDGGSLKARERIAAPGCGLVRNDNFGASARDGGRFVKRPYGNGRYVGAEQREGPLPYGGDGAFLPPS